MRLEWNAYTTRCDIRACPSCYRLSLRGGARRRTDADSPRLAERHAQGHCHPDSRGHTDRNPNRHSDSFPNPDPNSNSHTDATTIRAYTDAVSNGRSSATHPAPNPYGYPDTDADKSAGAGLHPLELP